MIHRFSTAFFVLFSFTSFAKPVDSTLYQMVENVRARKANAGLALATFSSKETHHIGLHGYADVSLKTPLSANTLFMIGSTTKAMTATLGGYLSQQGKVSWETKVKSVLPRFSLQDQDAEQNATLRDLLLHRTGLPRHDLVWYSRNGTSEQYLDLLPLLEPSAPFRERWQYQNLMYMVAGLMAAKVDGERDYRTSLQEHLFDNLGMSQSRPLSDAVKPNDPLAHPHDFQSGKLVRLPKRSIDGVGPAGSVHSSLTDMITWVQFNLKRGKADHGTNLDHRIVEEIHRPQIKASDAFPYPEFESEFQYGLGWVVYQYRGHQIIQHNGGIDGYLTNVTFVPELDLGLVILTNGGELNPDPVGFSVLDHYLKSPKVDWIQRFDSMQPMPEAPTDVDFVADSSPASGTFAHPAYGKLAVSVVRRLGSQVVYLKLNEFLQLGVTPWHTDNPQTWKFTYLYLDFLFYLDNQGKVDKITVNFEPSVAPIEFTRTF